VAEPSPHLGADRTFLCRGAVGPGHWGTDGGGLPRSAPQPWGRHEGLGLSPTLTAASAGLGVTIGDF